MTIVKLIRRFQYFLRTRYGFSFTGPILKNVYCVFNGQEPLATLNCSEPDQFWSQFLLLPTTEDASKLDLLYSFKFWTSEALVIREQDTNKRVEFLPAMLLSDDEEEIIDYFQERPRFVKLRGPYAIKA